MKTILRVGLALLMFGTFAAAGAPRSFAADDTAKIFTDTCVGCHNVEAMKDKLKGKQLTRTEWIETIERMKGLGAEVPRKKQDALIDYLLQTFGAGSGAATPTTK
jgi:mono/diheme cytochrome c family protein